MLRALRLLLRALLWPLLLLRRLWLLRLLWKLCCRAETGAAALASTGSAKRNHGTADRWRWLNRCCNCGCSASSCGVLGRVAEREEEPLLQRGPVNDVRLDDGSSSQLLELPRDLSLLTLDQLQLFVRIVLARHATRSAGRNGRAGGSALGHGCGLAKALVVARKLSFELLERHRSLLDVARGRHARTDGARASRGDYR